jgi:hypothetical protein
MHFSDFSVYICSRPTCNLGILRPIPFPRLQVGRKTGVLRPTCDLQFMRSNLTIYFSRTCYLQFLCWNHTHYFSRTFLRPRKRSERAAVAAATKKMTGGGCGGRGMRPLLCSKMRLVPALALKTCFAIGQFAPLECRILSSKGRAHAAPALCKNTLMPFSHSILACLC